MRNIANKSCRENQNTHFMFSNLFFWKNRAFYEIMSKNMVEPEEPQLAVWRMRVACFIIKATCAQAHAGACEPTHTHTNI